MRKITTLIVLAAIFISSSYAQQSQTSGQTNFTSFTKDAAKITNELDAQTSKEFKTHPDYGVLPFNAPCKDCYEVLQKRDEKHRYFLKNGSNAKTFYSQSSYGNINYRDNRGFMRIIDYRLKPGTQGGIFGAENQPFPVTVNLRDKYISILNAGKELEMNRQVSMFVEDAKGALVSLGEPSWADYTAGDDGVVVHNFYPGVDLEMHVGEGKVETFYRLNKSLELKGTALVIRDNVQLPKGFVYDYSYSEKKDGKYAGALCINNESGSRYFIIGNPAAIDENGSDNDHVLGLNYAVGNDGSYNLYIPISWMNDTKRSYPLLIDPFVTATSGDSLANITGSGYNATCFAGGCTYSLPVTVPAACVITDITYSFNYRALGTCDLNQGAWDLTFGTCRNPSTSGQWHTCSIGLPGLCILQNLSLYNDVKACIPAAQCASYNMPFVLTFYRCVSPGTGCGFSCINADTPWDMTVTGQLADVSTAPTSICQGSKASLTATATDGVPPYTYTWYPGAIVGSTISVSPASTTTYTVIASTCGGLDTVSATSVVAVQPNDNPGFTISPNPTCPNSPIQITGLGSRPLTSYDWTTGGTPAAVNSNKSFTVTYSTPGKYNITLIDTSGECIFDSTLQVTIANIVATAGPDTSVCSGSTVQLNATGGNSYSWAPSTGLSATNISNPIATVGANTTYTVTVTGGNNCSATTTVSVTVRSGITVSITPGGKTSFCPGGSVQLVASGGSTYLWSNNATTSSITVNATGTYSVVGTNVSGCTGSASQSVTVNPNPTINITAGGPTTFCQGGSVQLTASGGSTYSWSTGTSINPITASAAGTYSVVGTDVNGCTGTASQSVNVNPNPTVTVIAQGDTAICEGGSVQLCASNGTTFSWNHGGSSQCVTAQNPGNYIVTITDINGCTGVSAPLTVTVALPPTVIVTPGGPTEFCAGGNVTLTAATADNYKWNSGQTTSSIVVSSNGSFFTTGTNNNGCSATSNTVTVVVDPLPTVVATANGLTTFCQGDSVILTGSGASTYVWNPTNATTSSIVVKTGGSYFTVGTDTHGCTGTSNTIMVTIQPNANVTISPIPPVCLTSPAVTLTGSPAGGVFSGPGVVGNTFDPSLTGVGTFTITYTYTASGFCVASSIVTTTVTVSPQATVSISISPTIRCLYHTIYTGYGPQDVTLTANSTSIISSYQWYENGSAVPGATSKTFVVSGSGIYNVIVTVPGGCPSDTNNTSPMVVNVVDIRCGEHLQKVILCHVPPGDTANPQTLCISPNAVPAHLRNHIYDCLGPCTSGKMHHHFRLAGDTESDDEDADMILTAYPNPFSSISTIEFERTSDDAHVLVEVYTLTGEKVATLFDSYAEAGVTYKAEFDGTAFAAGVYIYRITGGDKITNGKLILIK